MKIAVVGAGLIGRAWAIVFARAGYEVALHDASAEALAGAPALIEASLRDLAACGLIAEVTPSLARIRRASDVRDALEGAVHAQESIAEDVEAKRSLFTAMDAVAPPGCVLASSSSFLPASRFTENLSGRTRCLIAHPANPPHVIPIVELVPAPWTDPQVLERTRALFEAVGQVPVVVQREVEGFVLNRLQAALLNEAVRLVEDGYVTPADLDKTVWAGLGRRWAFMGPFETIDLNAPGGVEDYAGRYAASLFAMACAQSEPRRWGEAVIARIHAERRAQLPMNRHQERQAWRDRCLMHLSKHLDRPEEA